MCGGRVNDGDGGGSGYGDGGDDDDGGGGGSGYDDAGGGGGGGCMHSMTIYIPSVSNTMVCDPLSTVLVNPTDFTRE